MNTQRRAENGFITKASCVSVASLLLCFTYRNEACLSLEQAEAAGHGIRWAAAGTGDDRRLIQITSPGSTGKQRWTGAGRCRYVGNVVGVVVAKLDAIKTAQSTGDIPQNVNFAVSAGTARAFLDAEGVPYETAPSNQAMAPADVAAAARKFTVLVECWR